MKGLMFAGLIIRQLTLNIVWYCVFLEKNLTQDLNYSIIDLQQ